MVRLSITPIKCTHWTSVLPRHTLAPSRLDTYILYDYTWKVVGLVNCQLTRRVKPE